LKVTIQNNMSSTTTKHLNTYKNNSTLTTQNTHWA